VQIDKVANAGPATLGAKTSLLRGSNKNNALCKQYIHKKGKRRPNLIDPLRVWAGGAAPIDAVSAMRKGENISKKKGTDFSYKGLPKSSFMAFTVEKKRGNKGTLGSIGAVNC